MLRHSLLVMVIRLLMIELVSLLLAVSAAVFAVYGTEVLSLWLCKVPLERMDLTLPDKK